MANRNIKDVKRFVDGVSKEVGEKAYDPTEYATKEYVDSKSVDPTIIENKKQL